MPALRYIWQDRKRHLGLPLSFTRYLLSEDRLFVETGVLNFQQEEVMLYRVQDLHLSITLGQRLFRVGTVTVLSSDRTSPELELINIANPREVKETLHQYVEKAKRDRRISVIESMGPRFDMSSLGSVDDLDDSFL